MKKLFLLSALLLFVGSAFSAQVDTLKVFSASMQKDIKTVVILPEGYQSGKDFPVVYLLHGYGDTYAGWVDKAPIIKELADQFSHYRMSRWR